jgi:hypothetical protein
VSSLSQTWGTETHERQLTYPCDRLFPNPDAALYRGVTINSPAPTIFRWLCQLRAAPYSYDWIDNFGRQSPPKLTPGLEELAVGQDVMTIFKLVDFTPGEQITIRVKPGSSASETFGDVGASYLIVPETPTRSRLLVKLAGYYPKGITGLAIRIFLPWGDLIMMRRQLLNLKRLAEATP